MGTTPTHKLQEYLEEYEFLYLKCCRNAWYLASIPKNSYYYYDSNLHVSQIPYMTINSLKTEFSSLLLLYPQQWLAQALANHKP